VFQFGRLIVSLGGLHPPAAAQIKKQKVQIHFSHNILCRNRRTVQPGRRKIKIGAHAPERRGAQTENINKQHWRAESRREQFCWLLKVSKGTERAYYTKPKETPRGSHSTLPR
jgi:hypothetical protein